ncbi:MAG TPA: energy-coupling factor transporter ATPase, partial [Lachnospiraceae bacterium]|nr:energy-coupling factor transporter ATPase [Lachnospiraceae bacterium]
MGIIKSVKLAFDYLKYGEDENDVQKVRAIDDVTIDIE